MPRAAATGLMVHPGRVHGKRRRAWLEPAVRPVMRMRWAAFTRAWVPTAGRDDTRGMPEHTPTPGAVVAVVGEDDRFSSAWLRGVDLAVERRQPLILYDWDSASLLGEPLPTHWSSDGWEDRVPDRLDPSQLDAAGRAPMAEQVRRARDHGVDAYAWLPADHGASALAEYAGAQGATAIVVPADLSELGGLDAVLAGTSRPAEELERTTRIEVIVA